MTIPSVIVRPAVGADMRTVADIYAHYVLQTVITFDRTPPAVAEWERRLDDLTTQGLPFLVAELSGTVTGYAYASPWRTRPAYQHTVENTIYLAPDATGRGMGTALLDSLITETVRAGRRQMIAVIADTGSDASLVLHRRFGFADAGRLTAVGRKHGRWIDTLLLQRPLQAEASG